MTKQHICCFVVLNISVMPLTKKEQKLIEAVTKRIRELRIMRGMTQADLAHEIGKDRQSLQRLESGHVNPSIVSLYHIAKGLDVKLSELFEGFQE